MTQVFFAKVKSILSADTLILTSPNGTQERTLTLAYLQAPRLQANEKYAFESRELLRTLLVGKQVKFWVLYKNSSNREFGDISTPIFQSLIEYVLSKGAAKLRDNINAFDEDEDIERFRKVQKEAELAKVGLWNPDCKKLDILEKTEVSNDPTPINAIVEKVLSGDRLLVRLLINPKTHAVVPVLIAGVKTPRSSSNDEPAEEYGDVAKSYVEKRLLMASVKVAIIGESLSGVLVGKIIHPNGNIAEKLLIEGLAEVSDWQSQLIGSKDMAVLRKAEKEARNLRKNIWKNQEAEVKSAQSDGDLAIGKRVDATVARIISADTVVLRLRNNTEITVQLISLRAPRASDLSTAPFVAAAKEYVRQKLIGKHVEASIESIREGNDQYDERFLVTLRTADGANINENIVANGYASVIRHRKGEYMPEYWDSLIETEALSVKSRKGIHGKAPPAENNVDASENAMRAKPYLFSFQNRNKITGTVEHVISGTRFRIVIPKEGVRLILVLGGLSSSSNKTDDITKDSLELAKKKLYQRDVNFEIYNVDKNGAFIGNIYAPGSAVPFQINLLREGLAETHARSVHDTKHASQMIAAEDEAKEKNLGVWKDYDPNTDLAEVTTQIENLKIEKKYFDAEVCEVLEDGCIAFHILDSEKSKLKAFMAKLHSLSHSFEQVSAVKKNEVVAAKLSDNGKFYRARILDVNKADRSVKVQHLDYGTIENISMGDIRELPAEFSINKYKPQAHIAQLSLINMPPKTQKDYYDQAIYFLEDTLLDKQVIACVTFTNPTPGVEFDVEIYDPKVIAEDPSKSINKELVAEGWGLVKKKNFKPFETLLQKEQKELLALEEEAKSDHIGCWQFGDIEGDDDF